MSSNLLPISYLARLPMANHDGVGEQIYQLLLGYHTENQKLIDAIQRVGTARTNEYNVYKRFRGKDYTSEDLKREDQLLKNYIVTVKAEIKGLLHLPPTEPMRRKGELALQIFKDFRFSINDGYEAKARKVINMMQEWEASTDYTLSELAVQEWAGKALVQAQKVTQLVAQRVLNDSKKVRGEVAAARKATDEAIKAAYRRLEAIYELEPTDEMAQLFNHLRGIEKRARQWYINGSTGAPYSAIENGGSGNDAGTGNGTGSGSGTGSGTGTGTGTGSGSGSDSDGEIGGGSGTGSGTGGGTGSGSGTGSDTGGGNGSGSGTGSDTGGGTGSGSGSGDDTGGSGGTTPPPTDVTDDGIE